MASNALRVRELADETPWAVVLEAFIGASCDSPHTARSYRRNCSRACEWLGIVSLRELDGAMLARYRGHVAQDRRLSPGSRATAVAAFRAFLMWAWAVGAHALDERVIRLSLRGIRAEVVAPFRLLDTEQTARLWAAASGRPTELALLAVTLGAGLRTSEVCGLAISDCLRDLGGGPALQIRYGKGGKHRTVPIRPEAFAAIATYIARTERSLGARGSLFRRESGESRWGLEPVGASWVRHRLRRLLVRAGIEPYRVGVHGLRHMYAISVLRSSGNMVIVSKLLGHASLNTTLRYVDHLALPDLRAALPGPAALAPVATVVHNDPVTVTTEEAARRLGCTRKRVTQLCRDEKLIGMRVDGRWQIYTDSLERLLRIDRRPRWVIKQKELSRQEA